MSQADEEQASKGEVEKSQSNKLQTDELQSHESRSDESQSDEAHANEAHTDEAHLERERASGNKLWSVYISEAQNYDQGLIEGWRSEMDGLLIFAGLFSGVVTTFIIDSYKTLNPDPGSQTVILLSQISHQLANMDNGMAVTDALPPTASFSPPISSIICNALWFTSLALSLSSALVATLVKQWAREYQHRTTMFSSISIRSRVYMYLYYGLRRFNMHLVVGIPPLLLHASLVLFFAGLVAFLVPVNIIITAVTSALLFLFVAVYGTFTALPLLFLDCPYQTPLTRILWSLNQSLGSVLRAYIRRATAACRAYVLRRAPATDAEKAAQCTATDSRGSAEPSAPADTGPQPQSMVDALRSEALYSTAATETRALAWTVRSLSDDQELEPFVEGLPQTLWDFDKNKPRSIYRAQFQSLLQDPEVHLGLRLADFMIGSNSNLLEPKDRLRRQISVLRAIWAICAFSLHTGSPLQSPIGQTGVEQALLSSKFIDCDDVQSMIPDVSALIRLNMIESRSRKQSATPPSDSAGEIRAAEEERRQAAYADYLVVLSKCAAGFQRDVTNQTHSTKVYDYRTLHHALEKLIDSALYKTAGDAADNVVFAARLMISPFAQTSEYPHWPLWGLGQFLLRHPSLAAASDPEFDSTHHYTRFLCHKICKNLKYRDNPQESVDALQLIYRKLLEYDVPPNDVDTHLRVLRTLRTEAAAIRTHRLAAIVQSVVFKCFGLDLSEWERWLSNSDDADWFRSVLGLENDERTERSSAQQIYDCARVGMWTTLLEQCTAARSPDHDQTERDMDFATLKSVHAFTRTSAVILTRLQRRFAVAAAGFICKYPKDCFADDHALFWVLFYAVNQHYGWLTNADALSVLDTALSEVQTDDQQESHQRNAELFRGQMQNRLHPEDIFTAFVSLVSDGERRD